MPVEKDQHTRFRFGDSPLSESVDILLTSVPPLLITPEARSRALCCHEQTQRANVGESAMNDFIFVGILILFFVVSGAYVRFCENL